MGIQWSEAVIAPGQAWNDGPHPVPFVFFGSLEGNGHVILNLSIEGYECLGLFGMLGLDARISNLALLDVEIHGVDDYIGALAGYSDSSRIKNTTGGERKRAGEGTDEGRSAAVWAFPRPA